jgi:hypothetical protein
VYRRRPNRRTKPHSLAYRPRIRLAPRRAAPRKQWTQRCSPARCGRSCPARDGRVAATKPRASPVPPSLVRSALHPIIADSHAHSRRDLQMWPQQGTLLARDLAVLSQDSRLAPCNCRSPKPPDAPRPLHPHRCLQRSICLRQQQPRREVCATSCAGPYVHRRQARLGARGPDAPWEKEPSRPGAPDVPMPTVNGKKGSSAERRAIIERQARARGPCGDGAPVPRRLAFCQLVQCSSRRAACVRCEAIFRSSAESVQRSFQGPTGAVEFAFDGGECGRRACHAPELFHVGESSLKQ